jgi:hypothetical protein
MKRTIITIGLALCASVTAHAYDWEADLRAHEAELRYYQLQHRLDDIEEAIEDANSSNRYYFAPVIPKKPVEKWSTDHTSVERDRLRREEIRRVYGREPTPQELSQISQ